MCVVKTATHHVLGLAVAVAVAPRIAPGVLNGLVLAVVTVVTAGGALSPDMDQQPWWRMFDRAVPDEVFGHGGPLQHRGITHWWGLPASLALVLAVTPAHGWAWWACAGVALGWASHLLGDFVVGAGSPYRDAGIPLAPWWAHAGLGAPCGGWVERLVGRLALPAVAAHWLAISIP